MQHVYRFDRAELRPGARQLLIDGIEASLGGRAFDLLVTLLERRGSVVSKGDLLDLVWPGLVVEENNLQVQVGTLRKLLGRHVIATIPGRGYRFDPSVELISGPQALPARVTRRDVPAPSGPFDARGLGPAAPTKLLGREGDLAEIHKLCAAHRLVTIVGAGGIGKTRLAQALALAGHPPSTGDDVAWVDLAVVSDSALVPTAFASAFGITLVPNVDPFEAFAVALRSRTTLVVVDNAEHLVDAVARAVARLLAAAPTLRVLVTSQQPLKVAAEHVYRPEALAIPASPYSFETACKCSAVALFGERAESADRRFQTSEGNIAAVVQLCQRLDGIPLAIELAAARLPSFGLDGLLQHLDERLHILTTGDRAAPTRQQTLRATLDWSHDLLSPSEQALFRRLGVFLGGFDIEQARVTVCDETLDPWSVADLLANLVDRSLVNVDISRQARYSLPETGRVFALEKLRQAGEVESMRRRHAQQMRRIFELAFEDYWILGDTALVDRYAPHLDNFRAAMGWAREGDPIAYIAMTSASILLLRHLSLIREGAEYLSTALPMLGPDVPEHLHARLCYSAAMLGGTRQTAERAIELYRQQGAARGEYLSLYWLATQGDASAATLREVVERKRRIEDPGWPAKVLSIGGGIEEQLAYREGRYDDALRSLDHRIRLCEPLGADDAVTSAMMYKVIATFAAGDIAASIRQGLAIIERCRRFNNSYRLACIQANTFTAMLLSTPNDLEGSCDMAHAFATLDRSLGWPHGCDAADAFALIAALEGRLEDAARLIGYAHRIHQSGQITRDAISARACEAVEILVRNAVEPGRRQVLGQEGVSLRPDDAARIALPNWAV